MVGEWGFALSLPILSGYIATYKLESNVNNPDLINHLIAASKSLQDSVAFGKHADQALQRLAKAAQDVATHMHDSTMAMSYAQESLDNAVATLQAQGVEEPVHMEEAQHVEPPDEQAVNHNADYEEPVGVEEEAPWVDVPQPEMDEQVHEEHVHEPLPPEVAVEEHPHPLDIAMPCEDGRYLPQAVLAGFEAQGIPYRLWMSTTFSNRDFFGARNHVREFALKGTSPYILMTDNDLVYPPGAWERMITWLESHEDFGAIGISKHGVPDASQVGVVQEPCHIDGGTVMFRREVLEQVTYDRKWGTCECQSMCHAVRELGYRMGRFADMTLLHIVNTRLD